MKWYSIPLRPAQLTLKHVLKSGQSFRWTVTSLPSDPALCPPPVAREEYSLCLKDRLVLLRQGETELHYAAVFPPTDAAGETREEGGQTTLAWIEDYFQLDVDLEGLYGTWGEKDEVFRRKFGSVEEGGEGLLEGIRVLRQDPWDCRESCLLFAL
jgi:N-glycosylase/DNA lyase